MLSKEMALTGRELMRETWKKPKAENQPGAKRETLRSRVVTICFPTT